jgi:hypothetical protein
MKVCKPLFLAVALCAFFAMGSVSLRAQEHEHGNHSGYMHALTQLRLMRAYLNRWDEGDRVDPESEKAIHEIDAAMHEINEAGITDHKELNEHERIDFHMPPGQRYHEALDAGKRALDNVGDEGEWGHAPGLKHSVSDHIEDANHVVEHILHRIEGR